MAYSHAVHQILFPSGLSATASGDKANWVPGYVPYIIRAAGVVFTTSGATTSGAVIAFLHTNLASGSTASDLAVLNGPSGIGGKVLYKDGLNVKVSPGQKVTLNVRTAVTGSLAIRGFLFVEPAWDTPANNTNMVATT